MNAGQLTTNGKQWYVNDDGNIVLRKDISTDDPRSIFTLKLSVGREDLEAYQIVYHTTSSNLQPGTEEKVVLKYLQGDTFYFKVGDNYSQTFPLLVQPVGTSLNLWTPGGSEKLFPFEENRGRLSVDAASTYFVIHDPNFKWHQYLEAYPRYDEFMYLLSKYSIDKWLTDKFVDDEYLEESLATIAMRQHQPQISYELLDRGIDINYREDSTGSVSWLFYALRNGITAEEIQEAVSIYGLDIYGTTPQKYNIYDQILSIGLTPQTKQQVQTLLNAGANFEIKETPHGKIFTKEALHGDTLGTIIRNPDYHEIACMLISHASHQYLQIPRWTMRQGSIFLEDGKYNKTTLFITTCLVGTSDVALCLLKNEYHFNFEYDLEGVIYAIEKKMDSLLMYVSQLDEFLSFPHYIHQKIYRYALQQHLDKITIVLILNDIPYLPRQTRVIEYDDDGEILFDNKDDGTIERYKMLRQEVLYDKYLHSSQKLARQHSSNDSRYISNDPRHRLLTDQYLLNELKKWL